MVATIKSTMIVKIPWLIDPAGIRDLVARVSSVDADYPNLVVARCQRIARSCYEGGRREIKGRTAGGNKSKSGKA